VVLNVFLKGDANLKSSKTVLVCVTGQRDCDRLIRTGRTLADKLALPLRVLCIQPASSGMQGNSEELEYLRQTARDAHAEMTVYFNDDAPLMAVSVAKKIGAKHIVTGMPEAPANGFVELIHKFLPDIPISMVEKNGKIHNICPAEIDERTAKKLVIQA
jgi:K+-sensing histidine kinase KdpD